MKLEGFEILEELGHGGMASVYRARQLSLDREVAIKVFSPRFEPTPEDRVKFQNEAIVAASLKHPGIVQIHDAVFNGDVYCFVMELVRGYTVAQLAAQRGKLDETSLLDIAAAVASALGYAWRQHGVIHCDIKPDNVMVDSDGTIKILDLGLAKTSKALRGKNADDMVYGTPQYISPEQARGQNDLDCRTDIYSLGATLYYLATGSVLFPGVGDVEAMECQINGKAPNPHSQNAGLSIGFCSLLEKMLAKDRSKRQTDWDVVLNDIAAVRAGLPIQSGPPFPNCSTIVSGPSLSFFRSGRPPSGRLVRCPKQMQTQIPAKPPKDTSPYAQQPSPFAPSEPQIPKDAPSAALLNALSSELKARLPLLAVGSLAAVALVAIAVIIAVASPRVTHQRTEEHSVQDLDRPFPIDIGTDAGTIVDNGEHLRPEDTSDSVSEEDIIEDQQPTPVAITESVRPNGEENVVLVPDSPDDGQAFATAVGNEGNDLVVASADKNSAMVASAGLDNDHSNDSDSEQKNERTFRRIGRDMGNRAYANIPSPQENDQLTAPSRTAIETGQWTQDYDAALALAADRRIPVLLNFTGSDWCGPCMRIHDEVLSKDDFLQWSKDRIVLVTIDRPNDPSRVPQEFRGRNMRLRDRFEIQIYPTFVLLNPDGVEIGRFGSINGRSVDSFEQRIVQIAGETDPQTLKRILPVRPPMIRQEDMMRILSVSHTGPEFKPLAAFSNKLLEALDKKREEADAKRKAMLETVREAARKAKEAAQKRGAFDDVLHFTALVENPENTPEGEGADLSKILCWRAENDDKIDGWLRKEQSGILQSAITSLERLKAAQTKAGRMELAREIDAYQVTLKDLTAKITAIASSAPRTQSKKASGLSSTKKPSGSQQMQGVKRTMVVDASKEDGVSLGRFEKGEILVIQYVSGTYSPPNYSPPVLINPDSTDHARRFYSSSERPPRLVGPMQSSRKRIREIPKGTSSKPFAVIIDDPGFYNLSAYSGDRWYHWTGTITYQMTKYSVIQSAQLKNTEQVNNYQW